MAAPPSGPPVPGYLRFLTGLLNRRVSPDDLQAAAYPPTNPPARVGNGPAVEGRVMDTPTISAGDPRKHHPRRSRVDDCDCGAGDPGSLDLVDAGGYDPGRERRRHRRGCRARQPSGISNPRGHVVCGPARTLIG